MAEGARSARSKTLDMVELLENILMFLDLRTLLLSTRVSKHFQAKIDGSMSIQRALFFRPLPTKNEEAQSAVQIPQVAVANPLLDSGMGLKF